MAVVDINSLQLKELAKSISDATGAKGASLTVKDRDFLLQKTSEFLGDSKRLIVTNRKQRGDGYFVLDISNRGYRLLSSRSVSRSEYTYSFEKNVFKLNGRVIDQSFLVQFIKMFDTITSTIDNGEYEVIEENE